MLDRRRIEKVNRRMDGTARPVRREGSVLLVLGSPPTTLGNKGDLFPTIIRHHAALFPRVFVYAFRDRTGPSSADIGDLDGAIYVNRNLPGKGAGVFRQMLERRYLVPKKNVIAYLARQDIRAVTALKTMSGSGETARLIAKELGVPYGILEHSTSFSRNDVGHWLNRIKTVYNAASRVAAVSENTLAAAQGILGFDPAKAQVIPNPLPEALENPATDGDNPFRAHVVPGKTFAAWTTWRDFKRLDLLLEAFAKVRQVHPDARLLVAGTVVGPQTPPEDVDGVRFLGRLERAQIYQLIHAIDFCCVPSDFETFGLPIVEALALGKPVISTATDGAVGIMTEQYLGRIVPRGDVGAFASAMLDCVARPGDYDTARIRDFAIGTYGQDAQCRYWAHFYRSMLGEPADKRRQGA